MTGTDFDSPPSVWANADKLEDDTYMLATNHGDHKKSHAAIIIWHWCTKQNRWLGQKVPKHTLVEIEPLHLEPSLACADDCGWHIWIRNGVVERAD